MEKSQFADRMLQCFAADQIVIASQWKANDAM